MITFHLGFHKFHTFRKFLNQTYIPSISHFLSSFLYSYHPSPFHVSCLPISLVLVVLLNQIQELL